MTRLADRYAIVFLIFTVAVSLGAWLWSGDPIRALSVLVIATPCPLILAVPVAIVSGLSRAAKAGVLIKGGKALEALARIRTVVIDKTGTLTGGARASSRFTRFPISLPRKRSASPHRSIRRPPMSSLRPLLRRRMRENFRSRHRPISMRRPARASVGGSRICVWR